MKARKMAFLLVLSLGFLWFSENFPVYRYFEPQSIGWIWWMSYAKDLIQPFAFYFFLCLADEVRRAIQKAEHPGRIQRYLIGLCDTLIGDWRRRALLAFGLPSLLEFIQGVYHQVWATFQHSLFYAGAFDPLDLLMYALGVALAVLVERQVFAKIFKFGK